MNRYRLVSKRDGNKDFLIRNDRYHMGEGYKRRTWDEHDALDKARREKATWELIEPTTQFKIEVSTNNGGTWADLPRWA